MKEYIEFGDYGNTYTGVAVLNTIVIDEQENKLVYFDGVCSSKKGVKATGLELINRVVSLGYNLDPNEDPKKQKRFSGDKVFISEVAKTAGNWREVADFRMYRQEFSNQKIPNGLVYVQGNTREEAEELLKQRLRNVAKKMPIPLKNDSWLDEVVSASKIKKLTVLKGSGVWLSGRIPEGTDLELALINANCSEEWMEKIRRVPQILSVRTGVEDIANFDLQKWTSFLKNFLDGAEAFQSLRYEDQIGVIKLFELVGTNVAANGIRKYGKTVWHQMSISGILRSRVRQVTLAEEIQRVQEVKNNLLEKLEDEKNNEFSTKEGVAAIEVEINSANSTMETLMNEQKYLQEVSAEEVVAVAEVVLNVVRDQAVSEDNPLSDDDISLLSHGLGSSLGLARLIKNGDIEPIRTKTDLKQALMAMQYENIKDIDVAAVCARAKVVQEEFEIYQSIWEANRSKRDRRYSTFPALKGQIGDLLWEMCDADDVNILTAGNETNCCQHPLSVGGACVYYMVDNPNTSTVFRIKKAGTDNTIAQSFVWVDVQKQLLVFDNIESLGDVRESIINCYEDYLSKAEPRMRLFDIKGAVVGTGYTDVKLDRFPIPDNEYKATKPSNLGYTDIKNGQRLLKKFNYSRGIVLS